MYQPIEVETMRDSLLTLDNVRERLAPTENLGQYTFQAEGDEVSFVYPAGWQSGLTKASDGLTPTPATFTIRGGPTFSLTKDAALEAASIVGLQKSYTLATPGPLITEHMNYWYSHMDKELKLLATPHRGLAFTRGTISPFSNEELLAAVLEGVNDYYHTSDVVADYKFNHNLEKTTLRLIVPTASRYIQSARHGATDPDQWSVGINISNSLIGASSLELSGYLFSWWCTNGCTTTHVTSGKYRRKPTATPDEAYTWAKDVVEEVLGGLEHELDAVQALTQVPLEGELNETLGQMFNQFGVPANLRENVINNLVESDDLTAYGLLNSITAAANDSDLSAANVDALLRAGGSVSHALADRCEVCHRI